MKEEINGLKDVGVQVYNLESDITLLAWFVGGDPQKIKQVQRSLNTMGNSGGGGRLKEDGVYGAKTHHALDSALNKIMDGSVPVLTWINPLESSIPLEISSSKKGNNNVIQNKETSFQYFRIDESHPHGQGTYRGNKVPTNYNHVNINFGKNPTRFEAWLKARYNHYPLSDTAYKHLSNLKQFGKTVRVAGKRVLAAGAVLDILEFTATAVIDKTDADKKLGKATFTAGVSIGGRWAGAALGAKVGAIAGVWTGPAAAPVTVPIFALVGGIGGSFGGDAFAKWIVDITDIGD